MFHLQNIYPAANWKVKYIESQKVLFNFTFECNNLHHTQSVLCSKLVSYYVDCVGFSSVLISVP
jgi:hypothetical protein